MFVRKPILDEKLVRQLAKKLAHMLAGFDPQLVVYIENGGSEAGLAVASELGIPSAALDLSYPASRFFDRSSPSLKVLSGSVKEILYRTTRPRLNSRPFGIPVGVRVALVDDSASTGRTVDAAMEVLTEMGVDRDMVRVAVLRCGPRARHVVDHFIRGDRVRFSRA